MHDERKIGELVLTRRKCIFFDWQAYMTDPRISVVDPMWGRKQSLYRTVVENDSVGVIIGADPDKKLYDVCFGNKIVHSVNFDDLDGIMDNG